MNSIAFSAFLACLSGQIHAQTAVGTGTSSVRAGEPVTLNFANAEIEAVARTMATITGRNVVVDPRVKGQLTLITERAVPPMAAFQQFLAALRLQGFTVVESAGLYKVVPEADAKLQGGSVSVSQGGATGGPAGGQIVTQIFKLNFENAANLVPVLRPLISPNNTINVNPGNNSLVITDYADNLQRLARIVAAMDVSNATDVEVIPLRNAIAADLVPLVSRLIDGGSNGAAPTAVQGQTDNAFKTTLLAEPRSNSLILRAANPARVAMVRSLVEKLDQPPAPGSSASTGNIHVVYLKNAEATKVAQTLRAVISGEAGTLGQTPGQGSAAGSSFAPTQSGATSSTTGGMGTTPSFSNTSGNTGATGNGIVQADPMTNSLIITAPEAIYNNLRKVIDQLDKRRAQVYVEALITEVSTEKAAEIGIQWQAGKVGSTTAYGGTSFGSSGNNILNLAAGLASSGSTVLPGNGLNLVLGSGTVSVGGREIANLNMLARFLESDTKANILSTPNLVTLDNEEAKIVVGRNVPFPTGSYANTGTTTTVNPFTTIERKDVGLTLKVKPQISEGGTVRLQIYQEASAVIQGTATATTGPSTTKRSIESTVLVDDGAVIALGGLVEDTYSGGQEKVPVLGDIPYLGQFFRYDSRKRGKTNLIVFLRPVILRDAASIQGISSDRYNYIIGQQRDFDSPDRLMRREPGAPLLPPPGSPPPAVPYNVPTTAPLLPPAAAVAP